MTPEQVAAELGQLSAEEFVNVVREALGRGPAAGRRHEIAALLRPVLEETGGTEPGGVPQNGLDASIVLDDIAIRATARSVALRSAILDSEGFAALGPFFSSASVMRLLGIPSKRALDARRNRWTVLAAQTEEGVWIYPAFQIDATHARVHPWLTPVLRALRGAPRWGAALWLITEHPDLDGQPPRRAAELGTTDSRLLIRLAEQYAAAVTAP